MNRKCTLTVDLKDDPNSLVRVMERLAMRLQDPTCERCPEGLIVRGVALKKFADEICDGVPSSWMTGGGHV